MDKIKIIKEKAKFYLDKNIIVHIVTFDNRFYSGFLVDVSDNRLILLDKKFGEMFLLLEEIKGIEPYKEVGE
jgi:hypothetical protein